MDEFEINQPELIIGWFSKRGQTREGWKLRYFEQRDDKLFYFKTDSEKTPKGNIDLSKVITVVPIEDPKKKALDNLFDIVTPERTWHLRVEPKKSDQPRSHWLPLFKKWVEYFKSQKSSINAKKPVSLINIDLHPNYEGFETDKISESPTKATTFSTLHRNHLSEIAQNSNHPLIISGGELEGTAIWHVEGYLYKLGSTFKSWSKRYFILKKNILSYCKDHLAAKKLPNEPLKPINLVEITSIILLDPKSYKDLPTKRGGYFQIAKKDRVYHLFSDNQEDASKWIKTIDGNRTYFQSQQYVQPLFEAIEKGNLKVVEGLLLLPEVMKLVNGTDVWGWCGLHLAAKYAKDEKILKTLLRIPTIDVERKTFENGQTPLHLLNTRLTVEQYKEIFAKFEERGLDLEERNSRGETPLMAATAKGAKNLVVAYLEFNVKKVLNLNASDINHNTCLHYAALNEDVAIFELLQKSGGNVNLNNTRNQTPLDIAINATNSEMRTFISRGGFRIRKVESGTLGGTKIDSTAISSNDLKFGECLARGTFGIVWKGSFNGSIVAIKGLKEKHTVEYSETELEEFKHEVQINNIIHSPYIVFYYGLCLSPLYLVMEFCEFGSLYDVLNSKQFGWWETFTTLLQTTKAIHALHSFVPPIIHRDIKSKNFMVTKNWQVKCGDFGLSVSKTKENENELKKKIGTVEYMSPEVIQCEGADEHSDIYALGVVFWEITQTCIIRKYSHPYSEYGYSNEYQLINNIIKKGIRPTLPFKTPSSLAGLIDSCWLANIHLRPLTKTLIKKLNNVQNEWEVKSSVWETKRKSDETEHHRAQYRKAQTLDIKTKPDSSSFLLIDTIQQQLKIQLKKHTEEDLELDDN